MDDVNESGEAVESITCIEDISSHHDDSIPHNTENVVDDVPELQSDDDFRKWIHREMTTLAPQVQRLYPDLFQECAHAVAQWRKRFRGNPTLWKRLFKQDRVIKEVVESVPVIDLVQDWIQRHEGIPGKITIVDLCSGKGYLSMLLSEMLSPDRVEKCLLIDKAWPLCHSTPQPHHISWEHIYGNVEDENSPDYFATWPIPLVTCKQNLKQSREIRQLRDRFATNPQKNDNDNAEQQGPVLVLAVHLCGILSIQAVKIFQTIPSVEMLVLKPCCLPDIWHVKNTETFQVGTYCFPAKDVCARGNWTTQKKGRWNGPPRWHLSDKFSKWCQHLQTAMDCPESPAPFDSEEELPEGGTFLPLSTTISTRSFEVPLQTNGGYQNKFLYAEKQNSEK